MIPANRKGITVDWINDVLSIIFDRGAANKKMGFIDLSHLLGGRITIELRRQFEKDIIDDRGQKLAKLLTNRHLATIVDNDAPGIFR